MNSFIRFLCEANSAGSSFEQQIADNINLWLKENDLSHKFNAIRYLKIEEDDGNRDEDYSDILIENLETHEKFFIECKESTRSNIITLQFDILEDGTAKAVKGKNRDDVDENQAVLQLENDIALNEEFKEFIQFLNSPAKVLGNALPSKYYYNKEDITDNILTSLIKRYNTLVDDGKTEADNKKFDTKLIRDTTRNMLAVALCWRLSDVNHSWDICHLNDLQYFGDLIRDHYVVDKTVPAKYIQFNDDLFKITDDNPFSIDCIKLPTLVSGSFDLKFTPRFGTGSIYLTPRSKITSEFKSNCSFSDEKRFPKII